MKDTDFHKIKKTLEKHLDKERYEHTLGVAYTAASLAMRYEESMEDAFLAGLLHDCAKCISNEKKIQICEKHNIPISPAEQNNPFLLHAKAGAWIAQKKYEVHNETVLAAIRSHTTGRPGMTTLEKIVYIADYIEPGRCHAPNLSGIRHLAFLDLDKALLKILEDTLSYLKRAQRQIDPMTQETYEYYRGLNV